MTCSYWRGLSLSARECSLRKRSWNKTELAGNIRQLTRNIYDGLFVHHRAQQRTRPLPFAARGARSHAERCRRFGF